MSRQPIDALLDAVEWAPAPANSDAGALPHVTHSGTLSLAGYDLRVYRLSDGNTIIDAEDMENFLAP